MLKTGSILPDTVLKSWPRIEKVTCCIGSVFFVYIFILWPCDPILSLEYHGFVVEYIPSSVAFIFCRIVQQRRAWFLIFFKKEKHFQIIEHTQNILNTSIALTNCAWFIYRNFYLIQQEEKEFCSVLSSLFFFSYLSPLFVSRCKKKKQDEKRNGFLRVGVVCIFLQ